MVKLTAGHSMTSGVSRRVCAIVAIDLFGVNYDSRIVPLRLHRGNECNHARCGSFMPKSGYAERGVLASMAGVIPVDATTGSRRGCCGAAWMCARLPSPTLPVLQSAHKPCEPGVRPGVDGQLHPGRSAPWPNPISPFITTFVDPSCTTLPCGGRKCARIPTTKSLWI